MKKLYPFFKSLFHRDYATYAVVLVFMVVFGVLRVKAQSGLCDSNVPYNIVDLSASPSATYISPSDSRLGNCCSSSFPERCVEFSITLHPSAKGIMFDIYTGAVPPGSMYYQVNCGTMIPVGNMVCLSGTGPHTITFCKPGNNPNSYIIRSIPVVYDAPDVTTRQGCVANLLANGLDAPTVIWRDITSGNNKYSELLSCDSACNNPIFTAEYGLPAFIDYEVCGSVYDTLCNNFFYVCDTLRVNILPAIEIALDDSVTFCSTSSSINIAVITSGGDNNYSYTWQDVNGNILSNNNTFSASQEGWYYIAVNDGFVNCPGAIDSVFVQIDNPAIVNAGINGFLCRSNNKVTLNGSVTNASNPYWQSSSGNYDFAATQLQNIYNPTPSQIISGGFSLILNSGNDTVCATVVDTVQFRVIDSLIVSAINISNVNCLGNNNGSISVTVSGGQLPFEYSLDNVNFQSSNTFNNLSAGTYSIYVKDITGCSAVRTVNITQPTLLQASISSAQSPSCVGIQNGSINLQVTGGNAPYTFIWNNNATTQNIQNLAAGNYEVTVSDANGCTATVDTTLLASAQTVVTISGANTVCSGTSIILSANAPWATQFSWSGPNGYSGSGSNITINNVNNARAGNYNVTATNGVCSATATAAIQILPSPQANAGRDTSVCQGATLPIGSSSAINGTAPYIYQWSPITGLSDATVARPSLVVTQSNIYTLLVTDANGCTASDAMEVALGRCNEICLSAKGPNILGPMGSFSPPYMIPNNTTSALCIRNGLNSWSPLNNIAMPKPQQTTYVYAQSSGGLFPEGRYTFLKTVGDLNGPSCLHSRFHVIEHTGDGGYFMAINGSPNRSLFGATFFQLDSIPVCANTNYEFSAFVTNMLSGLYNQPASAFPNVSFFINGVVVATSGPIPNNPGQTLNDWLKAGGIWNSGNAQYANIRIDNATFVASGNDLGLDDITFNVCGPIIIEPIPNRTYCEGDIFSITHNINSTGTTSYSYYKWQRSTNNGNTWNDVSGIISEQNSPNIYDATLGPITASLSINNYQYRLLVANDSVSLLDNNSFCYAIGPVTTIQVRPSPTAFAGTDKIICVNDTVLIGSSLAASGGTSPYTFQWNNSNRLNNSQVAQPLAFPANTATFTLTVTDALGCSNTDEMTVTVSQPNASLGNILNITCFGANNGSIQTQNIGGIAPYQFLWSNNATTATINNLAAGVYAVTITDAIGCTATANYTIAEPTPLHLSYAKNNLSCFNGNDGAIDLTLNGGTPLYNYIWNDGNTQLDRSSIVAGNYSVTITDADGCIIQENIVITQPDSININFTIKPILCYGDDSGAIDLDINGGTTPYTYTWSNGITVEDISNLSAGIYFITITDSIGCSKSTSVNIAQPIALNAEIIKQNVTCNGLNNGQIVINGSGGTAPYTYQSIQMNSNILNNLIAGNYTITITDNNNCTIDTTVIITQPDSLWMLSIKQDVACYNGNNGMINTGLIGGTTPYTYNWNDGNSNADRNNLIAGNYSVTVVDAQQCSISRSYAITQPDKIIIQADIDSVTCYNNADGNIFLNTQGGVSPYYYSWSNGNSNADNTNINAGIYFLTITDANNCRLDTSFAVLQPTPISLSIAKNDVSCYNGNNGNIIVNAIGGNGNYNYNWNTGNNTNNIQNMIAGNYSVTVSDTKGCSLDTSIQIIQPSAILISVQQQAVSCFGFQDGQIQTIITGGSAPYNFMWNNNENTSYLNNIAAGIYSLTITDANNCNALDTININQPDALRINISGTPLICIDATNGNITANVSGGTPNYNYLWNNGNTASQISNLTDGNYSLTVTDNNACSASITYNIVEYQYEADLDISAPTACAGSSLIFTNQSTSDSSIANLIWVFSNQTFAVGDTVTKSFTQADNYRVKLFVYMNNGCRDTISKPFTVHALPNIQLENDKILCPGDAATIVATGGIFYSWGSVHPFTSISNAVIRTSPAFNAEYMVEGIDVNGCRNSDTIAISIHEVLPLSISNDTLLCSGNQTVLNVSNGYNYNWNPATSLNCNNCNQVITNIDTTTIFTVNATDINGCVLSDTVTVTIAPLPAGILSLDARICGGSVASLTAMPENNVTYLWLPDSATTSSIQVYIDTSKTFYLTSENEFGCVKYDSVLITVISKPYLNMSDTLQYCRGSATQIELDSTYQYTWQPIAGLSCNNCHNPVINTEDTTIYSVTYSTDEGCNFRDTIQIQVLSLPDIEVTKQQRICRNDNVVITAASNTATTASWYPAIGLNTTNGFVVNASPNSDITYYVSVQDTNGCIATDSVNIMVALKVNAYLDSLMHICEGNSIVIAPVLEDSLVSNINYVWLPERTFMMNNVPQQTFTPYEDGSYMVIISSGSCIPDTQSFYIDVHKNPIVRVTAPDYVLAGNTFEVTASASYTNNYHWTYRDYLNQAGGPILTDSISQPTRYLVTAGNDYGCIDTAFVLVKVVNRCGDDMFVPNAFTPNGDEMNDKLCIRSLELQSIKIFRIFNRWGELVFETTNMDQCWDGMFNGKIVNPDVYVYYAEGTCGNGLSRMIKGNVTVIR